MATPKGFETALHKLEEAVQQLESGELSLDQALKVFSNGVKQADSCRQALQAVELKVNLLLQQNDGTLKQEPFDDE